MRSEQEPGRGTAGEAGGEAGGSQCAVCEGGEPEKTAEKTGWESRKIQRRERGVSAPAR